MWKFCSLFERSLMQVSAFSRVNSEAGRRSVREDQNIFELLEIYNFNLSHSRVTRYFHLSDSCDQLFEHIRLAYKS